MAFISYLRRLAALVLGLVSAFAISICNAQAPVSEESQRQIETLVGQLGDASYQVRERAAEALLKFGLPTKAVLFAGMKSDDLEIARRCRRVWSEVRINAGWQQAQEVLGDSPQARELYEKMFLAASECWYELAESPRPSDKSFDKSLEQLRLLVTVRNAENWQGTLANVLYFGVRLKNESPQKELPSIEDLLQTGRTRQSLEGNETLRILVDKWTIATRTDGPAIDRLLVALRDRRPEAINIARQLLRDDAASAKQKQYALLALANSKVPEDADLIEEFLIDSSPLDILFVRGQLIRSQLRDVALAVHIKRNDQDPTAFGFNYLRLDDNTIYSPSSLGFSDPAEREAAFQKWSAFTARQIFKAN